MLTETNCSTCGGTLFLVQEITVITVITAKTFEKTQIEHILWKQLNSKQRNKKKEFKVKSI